MKPACRRLQGRCAQAAPRPERFDGSLRQKRPRRKDRRAPERFLHVDVAQRFDYLYSGIDHLFRSVPRQVTNGVSISLVAVVRAFLIASTVLRMIPGATAGTSS